MATYESKSTRKVTSKTKPLEDKTSVEGKIQSRT